MGGTEPLGFPRSLPEVVSGMPLVLPAPSSQQPLFPGQQQGRLGALGKARGLSDPGFCVYKLRGKLLGPHLQAELK